MLAYIGKQLIALYWKNVPEEKRKVCLHKVSCSRIVYQRLDDCGFWAGVKTYLRRRKTCAPGYTLAENGGTVVLVTKSGLSLSEDEINPVIIRDFKNGNTNKQK